MMNKESRITDVLQKWPRKKKAGVFALLIALVFVSFFLMKVEKTFSLMNPMWFGKSFTIDNEEKYQEENRVNILIMGFRGGGDTLHGEYLTDTMMVLSMKTNESKAALFSIPRDLFVRMPVSGKMEKINFAYAYGAEAFRDGLQTAARAAERVAGIRMDYAVAVDFSSFIKIIDMVGGVDVFVPKDFTESSQWGFDFRVPKGKNHMDSATALYYARSRYSTNDFDRARRQQDILMALGNKVMSLGVLANPIKLGKMLDAFSSGIDTNIDFISALGLIKQGKSVTSDAVTRIVFDDSPDGFLVAGSVRGAYVLYPKAGMENYREIKEKFRNIFTE